MLNSWIKMYLRQTVRNSKDAAIRNRLDRGSRMGGRPNAVQAKVQVGEMPANVFGPVSSGMLRLARKVGSYLDGCGEHKSSLTLDGAMALA